MASPTNLNQYYQSQGQALPSVTARASIYESAGLGSAATYVGSASQNSALLGHLTSSGAPTSGGAAPTVTAPTGGGSNSPAPVPAPGQGLTSFLNTFQTQTSDSLSPVAIKDAASSLASSLVTTPPPTPFSAVATRASLTAAAGIDDLNTTINNLKTQQDELNAKMSDQTTNEQGKPVAMGVISGRITTEQQQNQQQMDFITRQLNSATNILNTKLQVIQTTMGDYQNDYQSAVTAYNTAFDQQFQMVQFVYGVAKDQMTEQEQQKNDSLASLQYMQSTLAASGTTWAQIPDSQKSLINQLEVSAGMPVGFFQTSLSPLGKVISTTTRDNGKGGQYADIVYTDANGKVSVKSQYIGAVAPSANSPENQQAAADAAVKQAFFTDLQKPTVAVSMTSAQAASMSKAGTPSQTREQLIKSLIVRYQGQGIPASQIEQAVYTTYPDQKTSGTTSNAFNP